MARTGLASPATAAGFGEWSAQYGTIHIDVGTGDGRYALYLARREPSRGVVGLDTCLDHLEVHPRRLPPNLRFVSADARAIPPVLTGRAAALSVNFPFSALLKGLLGGDDALLDSLAAALAPDGHVAVRINARALAETKISLAEAGVHVERGLRAMGLDRITTTTLDAGELRRFPSTWAKRIGFGRNPRAVQITARLAEVPMGPALCNDVRRRSLASDQLESVSA
jgi:SAM-dependent methyltransferase